MEMKTFDIGDYIGGQTFPTYIPKRWGQEVIYANHLYCMKRLEFTNLQPTSMHLHVQKHETFLVVEGELDILFFEGDEQTTRTHLKADDHFVIPPGLVHQIIPLVVPSVIVECSTKDIHTDSIRLWR